MRIVSHRKLKEFYETKGYEDSRIALERWYDIHVVFADSVAGKLRFSGRLKRYEDIDNLLTNTMYSISEATTIGWLSLLSLQLGTSSFAGLVLIKITIR